VLKKMILSRVFLVILKNEQKEFQIYLFIFTEFQIFIISILHVKRNLISFFAQFLFYPNSQ